MGWQEEVNQIIEKMVIVESDWKFVTSGGGTLSVGTPIAKLSVAGTGGLIQVQRDVDRTPTQLNFGGLGGSVGLSLIPSPANFSFSIPAMPSAGRIYKLPMAGRSLSLREMKGAFVMFEAGADFGAGASGAFMFLGGNSFAAGMAGAISPALNLPTLIATSKACVRFGGMTATLLPANVGVTIYVGMIG